MIVMDKLKQKVEESIILLSRELYDENNKLRSDEYFEDLEDKQIKIQLLSKYKDVLKAINDGKQVINVPLLKAKSCPKEVQEVAIQKKNKLYNVKLPVKNGFTEFKGVACQIQYPDGKYHDTIVLYKGYSEKHKKEFMIYIDDNKICFLVVDSKLIMRDIINISDEMKKDFYNQFINQDPKTINLLSVPKIMRCLGVTQFEASKDSINTNMNQKEQFKSVQDEDGKYRYKLLSPTLIKYLVSSIKRENPDLDVTGEVIEDQIPGNIKVSILVMSKPIEQIRIPEFDIYSDYKPNEKKNSIVEIMKRIEPITYKNFMSMYNPKISYGLSIATEGVINHFVTDLKNSNRGISIILQRDMSTQAYRIMSSATLDNLKPISNPIGSDLKYDVQFGYDKNGFLFVQNQKLVKYKLDENNECYEERPYYENKYLVSKEKKFGELPHRQIEKTEPKNLTDKETIELLREQIKQLKNENELLNILYLQRERECEEYELERRKGENK